MTRPVGALAIAGLIVVGGLRGASPVACLSPWLCPWPGASASSGDRVESVARAASFAAGPQAAPKQEAAEGITHDELRAAIDRLGAFDYTERMKSAQTVRRARGTMALPALVEAAASHADGYVRYKALVLLSGYDDPRVVDQMELALEDPNDRLRAVAYAYFERHPDPRLVPRFVKAFEAEIAEFVRPALMRAMAAQGDDPRVRPLLLKDVTRGQDFFRSSVIDALGDYKATWAADAISGVAKLDGPLQDDAALALGKIGDPAALGVLAGLQRSAPQTRQPTIAAAICLLGRNCESHRGFLVRTLTFADETVGFQELLRSAAYGLAEIAATGDRAAAAALLDTGIPAMDPARAPIALALADLAVTNPPFLLDVLAKRHDRDDAIVLLREGFDMLEEDFAEEEFYVTMRRAYWAAEEGSTEQEVAEELVQKLEF